MRRTHWLLCETENFATGRDYVESFFRRSLLLHYDRLAIPAAEACPAADERFWPRVEEGLEANQRLLVEFVDELRQTGFERISDLLSLPQGYPSKLLHIVCHLLDGFIGIDTVFYNLKEDSHRLSPALRQAIHEQPERYWLFLVEAEFLSAADASILHQTVK